MMKLIPLLLIACQSRMINWYSQPYIKSLECDGKSLFAELPKKYEPSDIAYDTVKQLLYVVSDNGHLAKMTVKGELIETYKVKGKPDLEAIALLQAKPGILYLGVEYPTQIIEYDIEAAETIRTITLDELVDENSRIPADHQGLESMTFLENRNGKTYLLVGRQMDARVFVYETSKSDVLDLKYLGQFQAPGSGRDLSSLTLWKDRLWFVYDKSKLITYMDIKILDTSIQTINTTSLVDYTSLFTPINTLSMRIRGIEGLTFTKDHVFVAIDPPRIAPKDLLVYDHSTFFSCFASPSFVL
ncbi:hypothetical protein BC833DRAFT_602005 [Globomyces pollinis-pini]|nr:hypothetical protein BC833DRAFT_602005 [Globomyces pollinis-pini]